MSVNYEGALTVDGLMAVLNKVSANGGGHRPLILPQGHGIGNTLSQPESGFKLQVVHDRVILNLGDTGAGAIHKNRNLNLSSQRLAVAKQFLTQDSRS